MGTEKAIGKGVSVTPATPNEPKMNMQQMNMKGMERNKNNVKDIKDHQVVTTANNISDTGMAEMNMEATASSRNKISFAILSLIVLAADIAIAG